MAGLCYWQVFVSGFGGDDLGEQAFSVPAFNDYFFVEIQFLSESSHGEIALAEVWVMTGKALFAQNRGEIFGEINRGIGGKVAMAAMIIDRRRGLIRRT